MEGNNSEKIDGQPAALENKITFTIPDISHLSLEQQHLYSYVLKCLQSDPFKGYTLTKNDGQYIAANNQKRFIYLNFDSRRNITYMNIREDGDTRTAFNGYIEYFVDFDRINKITNTHPYYDKSR